MPGFRAQTGCVAYYGNVKFNALRSSQRARERGVRAVPRLCIKYPGFALQLTKITENPSQGNRRVFSWSAPNAIRLVDLATAGDGLDWPAVPCHPWLSRQATGSTLGQLKYLPICRTRGFPTSANFESKLSVRALMWSANIGTARSSCICLLLTYQGTLSPPPVVHANPILHSLKIFRVTSPYTITYIHWKYASGCRIQSSAAAERPGKTRSFFVVGTNMQRTESDQDGAESDQDGSAAQWLRCALGNRGIPAGER